MEPKQWNRRQLLGNSARVAACTALAKLSACGPAAEPLQADRLTFVTTTEFKAWQPGAIFKPAFGWDTLNLHVNPEKSVAGQRARPIEGFGGCFNELGWTSLQALSEQDRESVLYELFDPTAGARFTYCRMPIAANDFATEPYSYDEIDGDFELQHFSLQHDRQTLIPFIHGAQRYQPKLKLWASPWSPPSWMKRNHFFAVAQADPGMKQNGIRPDQIGHEGEDLFIQEPRYFDAYARYFGRFVDAYRAEGIPISMVMPQNEFNSAQGFPSCTWTPAGLTRFLRCLAPEMEKRGVDVFFGTLERGTPKSLRIAMADREVARFIKGVGVQWAGANALPAIHREFPALALYQTEQECGDGANSWSYTSHCWQLMKHCFRSGVCGYMYWNISTDRGGMNTWGWAQNSLVIVDTAARTFRYTHDYYLFKHLTHFVDVGAKCVEATGARDDALAFLNPNGTIVVLVRNERPHSQRLQVQVRRRAVAIELPPDSIGTLAIRPS